MKLDIRFDQDAVDGLILLVHSYYYRIIEIISDRSSVRILRTKLLPSTTIKLMIFLKNFIRFKGVFL